MLHTKFQGHWFIGSGEEGFEGFYHIWAWRPCWSYDPDCLNNFSFQMALETVYEIWFSEEKSFEIVDGRTTEAAYTKSSPRALGSGELKIQAPVNS